jgi:5-formyltetrahydrofolate cyclo-ligase
MNKAELRNAQRRRLREMPESTRARHAAELCDRLRQDPGVRAARALGVYLALPDEPDLSSFLREALASGKRLALPVQTGEGGWEFRRMDGVGSGQRGPWGLAMPEVGEAVSLGELDVVLVPGLAFGADGTRLGRGKGIYDRLLASFQGRMIGCGFPEHCVEFVPGEAHDLRLHEVWTGRD